MNPLNHRRLLVACLVLATFAGHVAAQNRYFVGSRNLGMGSTGVGGTTNALAVHFNPAGMAFNHGWDLQVPLLTVDAEVGGDAISRIDELGDVFDSDSLNEIQARLEAGTATTQDLRTALDAFLYELPDLTNNGGAVRGIAGPAFRWKNFGFSAGFIGNGGVDTRIDLIDGLALSTIGFAGLPTDIDCGGDAECEAFANDLVDAGGGQLSLAVAETLTAAAGTALASNVEAQEILLQIVAATAGGGSTLADNETGVLTTTLAAQQYTFSYAHLFDSLNLSIGGSARVLEGEVSVAATFLSDLEGGTDTFENLASDITDFRGTTSTEVAFDLGLMWRPSKRISVGLAGANLNTPEFDLPFGVEGTYKLDPLVRAGATWAPLKWFNVAADVDLTEVESQTLRQLNYRYVNLGTEFLVGRILSIWLGGYSNVAADRSDPVYTGGLGLRFGRFEVGLSGAVSSGEVPLAAGDDAETFPSGAAAAITISWQPKRL